MDPKQIGTQRPATEEELDAAFKLHFGRVWGAGWQVGYYAKADKPCICPHTDPDDRRIWNDGLLCGADAREQIEPRPVPKDMEEQEKEAA